MTETADATPKTCGACGEPITRCPECGGNRCTPGCVDRSEDGCACAGDEQ